jgi:hypothetical protein
MKRKADGLALIMVAGVLLGHSSQALAQRRLQLDRELERIEFVLDAVPDQILLPRGCQLEHRNAPGCVKIWHPRSRRSMTFLELCSAPGAILGAYARQATLSNGARVRYIIGYDIGGGSGGTEGELKGQLDLGAKVFALSCRDQGEWRTMPDWCVQYLRYLKVQERH